MKLVFEAKNESELPEIAKQIVSLLNKPELPKIVLFYGEMGAGKTTFISALCTEFGIEESISSPTFSLVNEYFSKTGNTVYHFDFYRIDTPEEALDMGIDEYIYSGNYCLIEWPEKIDKYLPDQVVIIKIILEDDSRKIHLNYSSSSGS